MHISLASDSVALTPLDRARDDCVDDSAGGTIENPALYYNMSPEGWHYGTARHGRRCDQTSASVAQWEVSTRGADSSKQEAGRDQEARAERLECSLKCEITEEK